MKAFLPLLLSFFFIISCQQHKEATISPIDEEDELQEEADSLPRATAIFWLDKYHMKELKKDDVLTFRTAKAKVIIRNDGTIDLLSFVEQQAGMTNLMQFQKTVKNRQVHFSMLPITASE